MGRLEMLNQNHWLYSFSLSIMSTLLSASRGCALDEYHHVVRPQQDDTALIMAGRKHANLISGRQKKSR